MSKPKKPQTSSPPARPVRLTFGVYAGAQDRAERRAWLSHTDRAVLQRGQG